MAGADAILADADQSARQHNFVNRMTEIAAAQVLVLLRQGNLAEAAHLARTHDLPLSQARVYLAQGDPSVSAGGAGAVSSSRWKQRGGSDERLKVMVLQAIALHSHGEKDKAVQAVERGAGAGRAGRIHPHLRG